MAYKDIDGRKNYQRREHQRKLSILNALKNKPCLDCGKMFPPECMDFDHRPGENKVLNIARMVRYSEEKLFSEIAKCDLVCANCHRIRTKKRISQSGAVAARRAHTPKVGGAIPLSATI